MRTPFQRDRDRIIHSTAFRRLTYKTQVFLFHEGDHFRTRLTHSLEVAQIARAIARQLELDEDLAEALALAHDLGHPPFGHAGERALDRAMAPDGGFDHNAQSFKIVSRIERKYAGFDGLNLSLETLEGLVKHNGPLTGPCAVGHPQPILAGVIADAGLADALLLDRFASLEAQVAALADDIAYNNHDLDDGLRAGLIGPDDLADVGLVGPFAREALATGSDRSRLVYEINRRLITAMVADVVGETRRNLAAIGCRSPEDVALAGQPVAGFSDELSAGLASLKSFLFARVYRHPRVMSVMTQAEMIVADLFERFVATPGEMPAGWRDAMPPSGSAARSAHVGDFVAGMTDRFAIAEHRRLFDATPDLR